MTVAGYDCLCSWSFIALSLLATTIVHFSIVLMAADLLCFMKVIRIASQSFFSHRICFLVKRSTSYFASATKVSEPHKVLRSQMHPFLLDILHSAERQTWFITFLAYYLLGLLPPAISFDYPSTTERCVKASARDTPAVMATAAIHGRYNVMPCIAMKHHVHPSHDSGNAAFSVRHVQRARTESAQHALQNKE